MVDFFTPEMQQDNGEAGLDEQAPALPYAPSSVGERFEQNIGQVTADALDLAKRVAATSSGDYFDPGTGGIKHEQADPNVDLKTLKEKFPDVPGVDHDMPLAVAQSMSDVQVRRQKQENILARYPSGAGHAILGFGADLVSGLLDPVGDAAFMVPVIGEARYGAWLARAGESAGTAGRVGVTLGVGAARGAAGGGLIAAGEYGSGLDPDMTLGDVAKQTLETAAMGGIFHGGIDLGKAAFGFPSDIIGTRFADTPENWTAWRNARVDDAATRTAAAQLADDQPVDVRPVFEAATLRDRLLGGTAVAPPPPDPEAATRLDNAVARAAGSPSPATVALEDQVRTARATPSEKVAEGAEAEAVRQIDAMREGGTLTKEDDAELSGLDAELARIDEAQKGQQEGGKGGAEERKPAEKAPAEPQKPRIIPAPEPVVSRETLGEANVSRGPIITPEAIHGHMEPARLDVLADRQAMPLSPRVTEEIRGMGGIQLVKPDGTPTHGAAEIRQILDKRKIRGLIDNRRGNPPDYVREALAERGWFGGTPDEDASNTDIGHLTDILDKDINGHPQYHEARVETQMLRDRQALRAEVSRAGVRRGESIAISTEKLARFRAEEEAHEAEWVAQAKAAALDVPEDAKPEDILAAAIGRDGQKAYDAGYGDAYVTQAESWIDERFADIDPDGYEQFIRDGFGAEPAEARGAPEGGYEPGADLGSENELGRAGEVPAGAGEPANGEPAEGQRGLDLGAAETDAERRAREGRRTIEESQQLPRANNGVEQKLADEGLFVPPAPRTLFQRHIPAQSFYSALTRSVENLKQERAPAAQWRAIIDNLPGVKKEEVDWSGVKEWLATQKGPVTKAEVLAHLRDNEVRVQEVKHGGLTRDMTAPDKQAQEEHGQEFERLNTAINDAQKKMNAVAGFSSPEMDTAYKAARDERGRLSTAREALHDRMVDETVARNGGEPKPTKYSSYTLPGGENYRELLMTLPRRDVTTGEIAQKLFGKEMQYLDEDQRQQVVDEMRAIHTAGRNGFLPKGQDFRSSHFDEPNVLAHVRFDDRTGPNGEKVLHVAEIQSDWHQKGRREGYKTDQPQFWVRNTRSGNASQFFDTMKEADDYRNALPESVRHQTVISQRPRTTGAVPNAPFKTSWHELAMKRMLRYAAEHGYDRLSWDTGETQADRYDLSKHLKRVDWIPNASDFTKDHEGTLIAFGHSGNAPAFKRGMKASEIANHVGKDVADKLLSGENLERMNAGLDAKVEGLDLKVGGEGMKGFYDKILPATVNKLAKKWGAKVESGTLKTTNAPDDVVARYADQTDHPFTKAASTPVHSIPITDSMRESVMQGQPMFERGIGGRGEPNGQRIRLASGLEATMPENVTPEEAKVIQRVQDMLKRIAPKADAIPARTLESTEGFQQEFGHTGSDRVTGATVLNGTRGLIAWSLESPDAVGTARHEVMHFLKDYLHPDEWAALQKANEEQGWEGRFDIAARYPGANADLRMEESAAEALNQWRRAPEWVPESIRPIFEKISQILGQIAAFLRTTFGQTVTADDVFSRIMSGEVGKREPGQGREFAGAQTRWSDEPGSPEELERRRAVLVKQRVTAMQDIAKRDAIMNYIDHARANGLGIAHGITAKMRGISESIEGSRDSTEADMTVNRQRYLGTLITGLEKIPGAQVAWSKRLMTADWTRELFELNKQDGKPGITKNPLALEIARAVQNAQDLARYDGNKAGAWIGDYQGYIARTAHNPIAIHQAGYEAWRDFTLERLDPAQTFEDLDEDEIERFMKGTWDALSTGIHLSAADGVSKAQAFQAGKGGNLAKRLSQEKVLHFKDADGWREYQQRFGNPDIELGVSQSLMRAGRDVALMKRWGSNPQFSFDKILRDVREKYRSDHEAIETLKGQEPRLREEFRHLTGEASIPKNDLAFRIISSARGLEDISKLNTVLLAHLSVGATKPYQLRFIGMGRWQAYTAAIRNLVQDKSEAGRATMEALHSNATGQIQQMMHGYEPFADLPGAVAKAQQLAMRLGGLPWLLGREKAGSTWETANFFGRNIGRPFEALEPKVQRILSLHAISPTEWEALRTAPDPEKDGQGLTYLTPKAADRALPDAIDAIDPDRIGAARDDEDADRIRQDIRENLAMKLAGLYSDTADRSVVTPGIAERALFTRLGGAYGGPLIGQYKTWAAAAVRQMWGQAIYGMERGEAVKALAGLAATMTAMGALRVSIGDALNGEEPDLPNGDAVHDLKLFSRWTVGGGGLGIFGDYVIGAMLRSDDGQALASNLESAFLGPVAEDIANTAGNLFNMAKAPFSKVSPEDKEIKAAGQMFGEFVDHLPVVNTFYVRHVLNWLFLDRLQEMSNPGYLQRYQHSVQERTGQHFYLPPSQTYLGSTQASGQ